MNSLLILRGKPIIAESFIENLNFDDRTYLQLKSYRWKILFWDYDDVHGIDPILELNSQLEVVTFEFNPKDPNILIGNTLSMLKFSWLSKWSDHDV